MSGIFGVFAQGVDPLVLSARMGARMRHHDGLIVRPSAAGQHGAIGHIGLGLLNSGQQPIASSDGAVTVWLCGEFYHQDARRAEFVRHSAGAPVDDIALALAVYLDSGAAGLATLDGAFVIAVWDERRGEAIVVNDRFGLYPHYFGHAAGCFCLAPEVKGVLAVDRIPRRLDLTAVAQYVRFQQLLGERTWIEDVHLLGPATILRYQPAEDRLSLERYWDWDRIAPTSNVSLAEAVEESTRLFQRAIDAMTAPPLRLGVYLSGGLDGRTIVGFIDAAKPVTTFTFGAAGCRDVVYGTALARRAGRPHRWFAFEDGGWVREHADSHLALTEGFHSWMHMHGISTLCAARESIDVHLSGWDGGTTMGGRIDEYHTDTSFRHAPDEATFTARLFEGFCHTFTWPGLTDADADALCASPGRTDLPGRARDSFAAEVARTLRYPQPYRADYFYLLQRVRRSTQNMIVFQRSQFEVRCPFFDYSLIDFLYSLPEPLRSSAALHHGIITRRMPALARVPNDKDDLLPHSGAWMRAGHAALQRVRRGVNKVAGPVFPNRPRLYADYEMYLRTDLRPWAEAILFDERTQQRELFDPGVVRQLWDRHLRGDRLWTIGAIAPLITLEMVLRLLFDAQATGARQ